MEGTEIGGSMRYGLWGRGGGRPWVCWHCCLFIFAHPLPACSAKGGLLLWHCLSVCTQAYLGIL
jgi:hypothetical protein